MADRRCETCVCFEPPKPPPAGVDFAAVGVANMGYCRRYPAKISKFPHDFCFEWRAAPKDKPGAPLNNARK